MADTWFVMIPPGYANKTDSEKELVDFRIQYPYPSQAWTDANAGKIIQGDEGNTGNPQISEQLVKWHGPYPTEDAAKAVQASEQQSPNPVNDAVNAVQNSNLPGYTLGFTGDLRKLMLRIAEGLIGGILIIMALESAMKETGTSNIVQAAKKYGKVALAA
jgi:hypothetical protein